MANRAPRSALETHEVANQPPPFEDIDLYSSDAALREAVARAGAGWAETRLQAFGRRAGSAEVGEWAFQANGNPPELQSFDRHGRRIN
jgi:putative acyl-CoA dehydrogenase